MITSLEPHQVFVFGSNLNGWHAGGAARQAKEQFGAIEGQGYGEQGQSYAIPTLDTHLEQINLMDIRGYLEILGRVAKRNSEKEYLLTPIGTGIAGYKAWQITQILPELPENVKLVGNWEN